MLSSDGKGFVALYATDAEVVKERVEKGKLNKALLGTDVFKQACEKTDEEITKGRASQVTVLVALCERQLRKENEDKDEGDDPGDKGQEGDDEKEEDDEEKEVLLSSDGKGFIALYATEAVKKLVEKGETRQGAAGDRCLQTGVREGR